MLTTTNLERVLSIVPEYSVREKQLQLLQAIKRRTHRPGSEVSLTLELDYPLAWSEIPDEFNFHLTELESRGLVTELRVEVFSVFAVIK